MRAESLNVQSAGEIAVATLSNEADADNLQMVSASPYSVAPSVQACEDGKFILKAVLSEKGTAIVHR